MGTAFFRIEIVNIGEHILRVGIAILHSNLHNNVVLFAFQVDRLGINEVLVGINKVDELNNTAGKMEGFAATFRPFILLGNGNAFIQES